jgi:hypothetical protein
MKLIFSKDDSNEISVQLQNGTIVETFSYTEMVSQLLINNKFEDTDFGNLSTEEQEKIQIMLDKISKVFEDDSNAPDGTADISNNIFMPTETISAEDNNNDLPF